MEISLRNPRSTLEGLKSLQKGLEAQQEIAAEALQTLANEATQMAGKLTLFVQGQAELLELVTPQTIKKVGLVRLYDPTSGVWQQTIGPGTEEVLMRKTVNAMLNYSIELLNERLTGVEPPSRQKGLPPPRRLKLIQGGLKN